MRRILITSLVSGTVAALAMMPFGLAFRAMGLRVGYYGPKFASMFVDNPATWFLFAQHIVLGWISALPLVFAIARVPLSLPPLWLGALYGAGYYVVVNSLGLPLFFGDPTPWGLGVSVMLPSLVVHVVFGLCVAWFARGLAVGLAKSRRAG